MGAAALVATLIGGAVTAVVFATPAAAVDNGLERTPLMGFNDWNAFGCNVSAKLIKQTADYLVSSGLRDDGYKYVDIDDCWMSSARVKGHLVPDPTKFPHGIKAVANYVHARGLKLGIYESAGTTTCQRYPGSLGHEVTDADDFAKWGVDLLKYDNCGTTTDTSSTKAEYIKRYTAMANALKHSGRKILYSVCEWGNYVPWKWAGKIANQWRTTTDISDNYASMLSIVQQNAQLSKYAKPGAFNDPDMLEIGNGGMTDTEYRSEFSLWSIMAAPLIAGTDLRDASADTLAIYGNRDVIAVDQDSLGKQGTLISDAGGKYIFAKPLSNGDVAVALFNSTDQATHIGTTTATVSAASAPVYRVKNLWSKAVTESAGDIDANVPAHGTVMYRIHALTSKTAAAKAVRSLRPLTATWVDTAASQLTGGTSTRAWTNFVNDGVRKVYVYNLSLSVPGTWTAEPKRTVRKVYVASGKSVRARWLVTSAALSGLITTKTVSGMSSYRDSGGRTSGNASTTVSVYTPVTDYDTANTTGADATFAQYGSKLGIVAAGTGVNPAQSGFITRSASDEYGAIYSAGSLGTTGTVQATVSSHGDASGFTANSSTGIIVRNDATASNSSPEGVVLYLTGGNGVAMAYAADGGTTVDTTIGGMGPGSATATLPVELKLDRSGDSYTGSYSTDGGSTWTTVGTATLPTSGAATTQDAGVFHTSGSTSATEADFSDLTVS